MLGVAILFPPPPGKAGLSSFPPLAKTGRFLPVTGVDIQANKHNPGFTSSIEARLCEPRFGQPRLPYDQGQKAVRQMFRVWRRPPTSGAWLRRCAVATPTPAFFAAFRMESPASSARSSLLYWAAEHGGATSTALFSCPLLWQAPDGAGNAHPGELPAHEPGEW